MTILYRYQIDFFIRQVNSLENLNYIQEIGKLKSIKPHISTRKELDSFLFFIIQKGSGTVTVNGVDYHVNEGDVVFLNCQDNYQHISDENSQWELTWIHFNGINAQPFLNYIKKRIVINHLVVYKILHIILI